MLDLFFPKIWAQEDAPSNHTRPTEGDDKTAPEVRIDSDSDGESFTSDAQSGVKDVEALTSVWSKSHRILAYTYCERNACLSAERTLG